MAQRAGLQKNAAYLIRPDGYVGLAQSGASVAPLERYVANTAFDPTFAVTFDPMFDSRRVPVERRTYRTRRTRLFSPVRAIVRRTAR